MSKNGYNKNGDTTPIIMKNGRGKGTKCKILLKDMLEIHYIYIKTTAPFSIAILDPRKMLFYFKTKREARSIDVIMNDEILSNQECAELKAFVKSEDIHFLHNNLTDTQDTHYDYDPVSEMVSDLRRRILEDD